MSIEGVASYGEIYSDSLPSEDIKTFDGLGIEWQGRNVLDVRDDFCINNIVRFAQSYLQTSLINPAALAKLKAEIFKATFVTGDEEETSDILYRFDPVSGTYHEIIGAERSCAKSVCKSFKKAGKVLEKGAGKVKHAVGKGAKETGRWVKDHPVETAKFRPGINASKPGFVHSQQPALPQNNPAHSPAINKEIRPVSWAKGVPIPSGRRGILPLQKG
jgi:hypothetical protein